MTPPPISRTFLAPCLSIVFLIAGSAGKNSLAQADMPTLESGSLVERELRSGETHSYAVKVAEGQRLRAVIKARDIDLTARIVAANNPQLAEASTWNGVEQSAPITLFVETPGGYRLEVYALGRKVVPGRYELRIELAGTGTAVDRIRAAAERSFSEAQSARLINTAKSTETAIAKYQNALQGWRELSDVREEAETLHNIGLIYRYREEHKLALEMFNQALALKRVINDRWGEAVMLTNIGLTYWALGEGQRALESYDEALPLRRAVGDRGGEGRTLNAIALFYWTMGENQKALDYYDRALSLRRLAGDLRGEGITLHNIGLVYRTLAENQKALDYLAKALAVKRAVGDRFEEASTISITGDVYLSSGEKLKALECYKEAKAIYREVGSEGGEAEVLHFIGEAYLALGQPVAARESFEQSLRQWRTPDLTSSWPFFGLARAHRDLNQLEEARVRIEAALDIVESIRTRVSSPDLRTSFSASTRQYYEFYIDLLMRLDARTPDAGYADLALQANERARARGLLDLLSEARVDIRHGVDPKLIEHERGVQQKLSETSERLTRMLQGGSKTAETEGINKEIESLVTEYQEAQGRIRAASPRYASLTQPQPLNAKEIQTGVLDGDTLLLEYALGEDRSYLWAVTRDSLKSFELPKRAVVERAARDIYELLTARNRHPAKESARERRNRVRSADEAYARAAEELSRMLLAPDAAQLAAKKRLMIVGDGALQYVPFGALTLPPSTNESTTRAAGHAKKNGARITPLLVTHEIVNVPSASVLAVLRRENERSGAPDKMLAVFADPVFSPTDSRLSESAKGRAHGQLKVGIASDVERSAKESGVAFVRLRFSGEEAKGIAGLVPDAARLLALDFAANRPTAKNELGRYRVVHFATHGLINSTSPELSGLVLSLVDEGGRPVDGFLRLHEIYNLKLNADLVVLSACQTALGKEIKGEGLVGLTRGFMYAGSPRVVASLWRIDDRATAELMKHFYRRMLGPDRLPAAAALRAAQLEMLKADGWEGPYYWAAFTLQGEWR